MAIQLVEVAQVGVAPSQSCRLWHRARALRRYAFACRMAQLKFALTNFPRVVPWVLVGSFLGAVIAGDQKGFENLDRLRGRLSSVPRPDASRSASWKACRR